MEVTHQQFVARAASELPAQLQDQANRWLERVDVSALADRFSDDAIAILLRVVACSEFAANTAAKEWSWLLQHARAMQERPDSSELEAFTEQVAASDESPEAIKRHLRQFRNRYFLQVLWREIATIASLSETLTALSDLAEQLLEAAARYAERQMSARFGVVRDDNGDPVSIVVLGMGKLGGRELNFSSDIDLIFLYPGGTESDGDRKLSATEYFTRLSQRIVALLDEVTGDGFVFRVDTRLRPFGDSGPPVASFTGLESYLLQHGRGWERYAYLKARIVGPAPPAAVAEDLYRNLITPFVYRRYLDFGVFESLRDMHALIAAEVQRKDLANNIKLGPGGIREIEFITQSLQLVRGGSRPDLQERELQRALPKLVGRGGMQGRDVQELLDAYAFLRRLENFIQAMRDQQTHELPTDEVDQARLSVAMRFPDWSALCAELDTHRRNVANQFATIAFRDHKPDSHVRRDGRFAELWKRSASPAEWTQELLHQEVNDAQELAKIIFGFRNATATQQIDATARRRLRRFMANLTVMLKDTDEPRLALTRTLTIVETVLRRSAYLALLNENEQAMLRLVNLCERSATIADQIARYPMLLDELLDPRIYTAKISKRTLNADLQQRLLHCPAADSEQQMELLGQYQRASQFRIAVADLNGSLPVMRVSDSLTELAEIVLDRALQVAWRDMTEKHGVPRYLLDGVTCEAGFGIVGYGKLGGLEFSYGSDLDLVFLHDSQGAAETTDGTRPLPNTMFFTRLVRRLTHFLTTQTGSGMLYEVDTRLRPDGQSGLLVTSVDAFERYQDENAWTWEHQALLRARPVAGNTRIADEFARIRNETLTTRVRRESLHSDVLSMRHRMRAELDKTDEQQFDLKQGNGGIGDIEFIVQYLVLANAASHPSVVHFSDNIRQLDALAATARLDADIARSLQDIYRSYRSRLHQLLLDDRPAMVSQTEFSSERDTVRQIWSQQFGS